ncbi:hypothetical protein Harman_31450 [Haloarcula mannanilytica]|uniref:Acyltransferase n=1 Tax=Haloarcula mannanilytica TaxID=2509225 RepID=A0A4C2EP58_9EURY|nr:acyltransferase [Haloarcula mannanilytica]GCF15210.1 hypothetical protein Harman_31450 [Haloarcula mannanilytica]
MKQSPFNLLAEKGLVTFAVICKSYLASELYKRYLNSRRNVSIDNSAEIDLATDFGTSGNITIRENCRIRKYTVISPSGGEIEIGANSLVNAFGSLLGHGSIHIGQDVLIGPHTTIVAANHTFSDQTVPIVQQEVTKEGITIHDDVWIGANCTVLDGVTIGEGAVVAAGSVVTESVPESTVVAGTPAEQIDTRN